MNKDHSGLKQVTLAEFCWWAVLINSDFSLEGLSLNTLADLKNLDGVLQVELQGYIVSSAHGWYLLTCVVPPPSHGWLGGKQQIWLSILDNALPLNFEAAEQSSLEITSEIEQKGHYYTKESTKPIHTAARSRCRGAEMSRFEHMPKAMPHTQKGLKGLQRASTSFNCFRKSFQEWSNTVLPCKNLLCSQLSRQDWEARA